MQSKKIVKRKPLVRRGNDSAAGVEVNGDTAARILDVAQELFQTRGYNGISYQDISDRVGIRKASIHHHFASKADLAVALVRRYRACWKEFLKDIDKAVSDPVMKLDRYVEPFRATVAAGDRACLCGVLGAEFASLTAPVQHEITRFFKDNEAWLAKLLTAGRAAGRFKFAGDATSEAGVFFACLEGTLLVTRACGSIGRFEAVVTQLKAQLGQASS